jgi:hypothetical protein
VYSHLEIVDVIIDGIPQTIGTRTVFLLEQGQTSTQYIRAKLSELDLTENDNILIRAVYGQRELVRYKLVEKTLPLKVRFMKTEHILLGSSIVVIVLLILVYLILRSSYYECDRCGHQQKRRTSSKHSCGGTYKKK